MWLKIKDVVNKSKFKVNKILTITSAMVLVFYLLYMFFNAISTIIWSFQVDSYLKEEILKVNGGIFGNHSNILMSAIMLLYLSIFKKNIKIYMVAGIILFNLYIPTYNFVEFNLSQYLDKLGIYNWRKSEGQIFVNPQWTNVYLLLIGLIILFIQICVKKMRSIDRMFAFFISLSVLLTLTLFHSIVVFGYYKFQREYQVSLLERQMLNEKKEDYCKERMCFDLTYINNGKQFNIYKNIKNKEYFDKYNFFVSFALNNYSLKDGEISVFYLQNPETIGFDYFTFGIKKITNDKSIFVLDNKNKKFSEINIVFFSLLTSVAHTIWIILGYGILFFHKEYIFKRKKIKMEDL